MRMRARGIYRSFLHTWESEGIRAFRRIPDRLRREIASIREGTTVAPGSGTQPMTSASSVDIFRVELTSEAAIDRTNAEVIRSNKEWILLVPVDADTLNDMRSDFVHLVDANPHCDIVYADEDGPRDGGLSGFPILKPAFNPEMLLAYNYIGWPVMMRRTVFVELGGFDKAIGAASDHHLWLKAWSFGKHFMRLPKLEMRYRANVRRADADIARKAVSAYCAEFRPDLQVLPGLTERTVQVRGRFELSKPKVTLVVPTCQGRCGSLAGKGERADVPHIKYFLESLSKNTWPHEKLIVLVADDNVDDDIYTSASWPFELKRIHTPRPAAEPFSYARKMNRALKEVTTEVVVLMNDDMRIGNADWLEALMTFALDPDIGGVGARLMFPDGRIQHTGVIGGLYGNVAHAWFGDDPNSPTYQDWALIHRDWSMVTGAVFATRLSVLEEVNGFSESLAIEFNDLDMCLRIGMLGYRIVYTPHALLYHYEKSSRGTADTRGHELARFRRRWKELLSDDPAYHPGLTKNSYRVEVA